MVKTDIHEMDKKYVLEAEVPGIPKENIQINYENGVLTVEGQHQTDSQTEDDNGNLVRSERGLNSICRQFTIRNVREEEIKAEYKDGVLKVILPKDVDKLERSTAIPIE